MKKVLFIGLAMVLTLSVAQPVWADLKPSEIRGMSAGDFHDVVDEFSALRKNKKAKKKQLGKKLGLMIRIVRHHCQSAETKDADYQDACLKAAEESLAFAEGKRRKKKHVESAERIAVLVLAGSMKMKTGGLANFRNDIQASKQRKKLYRSATQYRPASATDAGLLGGGASDTIGEIERGGMTDEEVNKAFDGVNKGI